MVTSSAVVGSSQISSLRLAGQRHGDHGALALAAGELVRVGVDALLGLGDAGARQQFDGARPRGVGAQALVQGQHLADLVAHREQRVQRRHRLLEDHADARTADAAHLPLGLASGPRRQSGCAAGGGRVDQAQHRQAP
jgi:hypothetical protein